jgi:hypothetical protein
LAKRKPERVIPAPASPPTINESLLTFTVTHLQLDEFLVFFQVNDVNSIEWASFSSLFMATKFVQFYDFSICCFFCAFNMRFSVLIGKIELGAQLNACPESLTFSVIYFHSKFSHKTTLTIFYGSTAISFTLLVFSARFFKL